MANNIFLTLKSLVSEFLARTAGLLCIFLVLVSLCLGYHLLPTIGFIQFADAFILIYAQYQSSSLLRFLHYLVDFFGYYSVIKVLQSHLLTHACLIFKVQ